VTVASVTRLFVRPTKGAPTEEADHVEATAGKGLEGDHAAGGKRQITLLDADSWADVCTALGTEIDPAARRANVLVEGMRMGSTIGQDLQLGACRVQVVGETGPCSMLEDVAPGLRAAVEPDRRGGVYGRIVAGGTLSVGDPVTLEGATEEPGV
jgi:MOSC domain-containing protein YiiM